MKKIKILIILLISGFIYSNEIKPLSLRPFDVQSSGFTYGRGTYMIVLPDVSLESYLLNENYGGDFIKFKKSQGFDVEIIYYDEIATDAQELKDSIMNYYNQNPMLEYVLLIGDVNGQYSLPTFTINSYNEEDIDVTDYPYTFIDNSYDAKFFIGRWSIRSVVDLLNIKSRTIQYTKNDYIDTAIFDNALIVAGNYKTAEGAEVPPQQWPVTPVWTSLWLMDELYDYGYTQIDTAFFHAGNYQTGEYNPVIENSWNSGVGVINYRGWGDANGWHKPYFHRENVEDLSNGWRLPVVMSFVCNTGDFGNDYSGGGLPKCFGEVLITSGSMVNPKGATAVVGPSDLDTDTRFNNVICGVMWDALLEGHATELAQALHLGKQSLITEFSGLSAEDGTVIDEFYHHVYGVLGDPSLPVLLEQPKTMILMTDEANSNIVDEGINQSFIHLTILDENGEPLNMVVGALLDTNNELIGKGLSDQEGSLFIDIDSSAYESIFTLYLNKSQYEQHSIDILYVEDDGMVYEGIEPISINVELENMDFIVEGNLFELNLEFFNPTPYDIEIQYAYPSIFENPAGISVSDSWNGLTLNSMESGSASVGYIEFPLGTQPEIGDKVKFLIEGDVTVDGHGNSFTSNSLEVVIGSNSTTYLSSDPTPKCEYGYWAYDNTDMDNVNDNLEIVYDWMEINQIGTNLNLSDDTIYNNLDLGFDFKYFGDNYSQVNVCSNGWVSFIPTNIDYFWNFSIPSPLGPSAMIAPFMDDLDDNEGTEPFNVYYYNDNNERFIIQWDDVSNGEDDQNCPNCIKETFQLMLFNSDIYPTQTGDGEILFQYKEIHDIDQNGNYSTIGIESPDQNDGIQYLFSTEKSLGATWVPDEFGMISGLAVKFTTNSPLHTFSEECIAMDINQDSFINVVDIVQLVNIIFGIISPTETELCASDSNGDGAINVVDVVTLVNYILSLS